MPSVSAMYAFISQRYHRFAIQYTTADLGGGLQLGAELWNERRQLPGFVRAVAPYLPAYHYGQLAWSAVGAATEPMPVALAWLAGYTALFLAIAFRAYRREESRKFG